MSNSSLVNRLQTELHKESHTRQLQQDVNSKLQSEYDDLLKRLAEAENHIDQLRLGNPINVNRQFVITHEHRYSGDPGARGGFAPGHGPVRPHHPVSSTTTANACIGTSWEDTEVQDIEGEETLVSLDERQPQDSTPDHSSAHYYTLDVHSDQSRITSHEPTPDPAPSAHPLAEDTSSLSTEGDETCISQMSVNTIADRGSAESIQYAHLLKIKSLQGKIAKLKSKLNDRGSSFDEVLRGLQEVEQEHGQLSEDISESQTQLEGLKEKYRGRASKRITHSQQAIEKELATLADQLSDLMHLLQLKAEESHSSTSPPLSPHHSPTPPLRSRLHTSTSPSATPPHISQPYHPSLTPSLGSHIHPSTSPPASPLHPHKLHKMESVERSPPPLPGASATESALHAQFSRSQSTQVTDQDDSASVVGSELSYDSSPYLPSKYMQKSNTSDVDLHGKQNQSHDTSNDLLQSSHDTAHDLLQSSHDSHDATHPSSHDQVPTTGNEPAHTIATSRDVHSSTIPPPKDETFTVKGKPKEKPLSSDTETLHKSTVSRQSGIPRVGHITSRSTVDESIPPLSHPSHNIQDQSVSSTPLHIPHTSTTSSAHPPPHHKPLYTPSHQSTSSSELPPPLTPSHLTEKYPQHKLYKLSHQSKSTSGSDLPPTLPPSHPAGSESKHPQHTPSQNSESQSTSSTSLPCHSLSEKSGELSRRQAKETMGGLASSSQSSVESGKSSGKQDYTTLTVSAIDQLRKELDSLKERIMRSHTPPVILTHPHQGHTTHRHSAHSYTPTPTHSASTYSSTRYPHLAHSTHSYTPTPTHSGFSYNSSYQSRAPHSTHMTHTSTPKSSLKHSHTSHSKHPYKTSPIYASSALPSHTSVTASPPHTAHTTPRRTVHTEKITTVELSSPEHSSTRPLLPTPSRSVSEARTPQPTPSHGELSGGSPSRVRPTVSGNLESTLSGLFLSASETGTPQATPQRKFSGVSTPSRVSRTVSGHLGHRSSTPFSSGEPFRSGSEARTPQPTPSHKGFSTMSGVSTPSRVSRTVSRQPESTIPNHRLSSTQFSSGNSYRHGSETRTPLSTPSHDHRVLSESSTPSRVRHTRPLETTSHHPSTHMSSGRSHRATSTHQHPSSHSSRDHAGSHSRREGSRAHTDGWSSVRSTRGSDPDERSKFSWESESPRHLSSTHEHTTSKSRGSNERSSDWTGLVDNDWSCPQCGGRGTSSLSVSPSGTRTLTHSHKCSQTHTSPVHTVGSHQLSPSHTARSSQSHQPSPPHTARSSQSHQPSPPHTARSSQPHKSSPPHTAKTDQATQNDQRSSLPNSSHIHPARTDVSTNSLKRDRGTQVYSSSMKDNGTQVHISPARDRGTQVHTSKSPSHLHTPDGVVTPSPGVTTKDCGALVNLDSGVGVGEEPSFAQVATSTPTRAGGQRSHRPVHHMTQSQDYVTESAIPPRGYPQATVPADTQTSQQMQVGHYSSQGASLPTASVPYQTDDTLKERRASLGAELYTSHMPSASRGYPGTPGRVVEERPHLQTQHHSSQAAGLPTASRSRGYAERTNDSVPKELHSSQESNAHKYATHRPVSSRGYLRATDPVVGARPHKHTGHNSPRGASSHSAHSHKQQNSPPYTVYPTYPRVADYMTKRDYTTRAYSTPTRSSHTPVRSYHSPHTPTTRHRHSDYHHTTSSSSERFTSLSPTRPLTPGRRERVVYVGRSPPDELYLSEPTSRGTRRVKRKRRVKGHNSSRGVKPVSRRVYVVGRGSGSDSEPDVEVVEGQGLDLSEALQLARNLKRRSQQMHGSLKELAKLHKL